MSTNKDKFLAGIASDSKNDAARQAREQQAAARFQAMSREWDSRVLPVVQAVVHEYDTAFSQARRPDRLSLMPTPAEEVYIGVARRAEINHELGYGPSATYVIRLMGSGHVELECDPQRREVIASVPLATFDKAWMEEALAQALLRNRPFRIG